MRSGPPSSLVLVYDVGVYLCMYLCVSACVGIYEYHVCMCVYVYEYHAVNVCVYTCVYVCVYEYHVCMYICINMCIYSIMCACACACVCVCVCVVRVRECIHAYHILHSYIYRASSIDGGGFIPCIPGQPEDPPPW